MIIGPGSIAGSNGIKMRKRSVHTDPGRDMEGKRMGWAGFPVMMSNSKGCWVAALLSHRL